MNVPSSSSPATNPPEEPSTKDAAEGGQSQVKSLSVPGLLAGGAAAATTSVIGGQLGISGTVAGAAITSVISAAVVAFYTDSVNGTARKLKQVTAKVDRGERRYGDVHRSRTRHTADAVDVERDLEAVTDGGDGRPARGRRIRKIVLMSLVIGVIGMAAVFGIQRITGTELSPGTGQIQRSVTGSDAVSPRSDSGSSTEDGTEQEDGTVDQQQDDPADGTGTEQQDGPADGTGTEQDGGAPEDGGSSGGDADGSGSGGSSGSGSSGSGSSGSGSSGGGDAAGGAVG